MARKRKRGPVPKAREIRPLVRYLHLPATPDGEEERLQPLNLALDAICAFNEKYRAKACRMTDRSNQETYVNSNICMSHHIIWNGKGSKKDSREEEERQIACNACTNAGRACVKLKWHPEEEANTSDTILVYYSRSVAARGEGSTWQDKEFWV